MQKKYVVKGCPLVKITSQEGVDNILNGTFRMTSLKKYRELYKDKNDNVIGDPNEGKLYVHDAYIVLPEKGVCEHIQDFPFATPNENDFVFCMFELDFNEKNKSVFQFSQLQKQKLIDFGDLAMIITDRQKFIKQVLAGAKRNRYEVSYGSVNYYDENVDDVGYLLAQVTGGIKNVVFHKQKKYQYQQEFRFTTPYVEEKEYIKFDIGDISDIIQVVSTKDLLTSFTKWSK